MQKVGVSEGASPQNNIRCRNVDMREDFIKKRLFSLSEAAAYLGRSTWSVRRLIWSGALPSVRAGGRVHVDVRDMDAFIDKHKVTEDVA